MIGFGSNGKPMYRDKHPCTACETGYLDCAALAVHGLKCCKACEHPTRWSTVQPYTTAELDHMRFGAGGKDHT